MKVEYVYPSGKKLLLDSNRDNYLLPVKACLEVSGIKEDYIFIDSRLVAVNDSIMTLEYNGEEKVIESGEERFRINPLKEVQPDKFKIEYHEFVRRLYENFDENYSITEEVLISSIQKDNTDSGINLCTFNRKIEDINKDILLEEIYRDVKHLTAIFYHPRIHLMSENEIRPVDTVVRIGHEAIKYLSSHSEHWEARKANGLVPARLLARTLEDDYGIYENIAAKCLVDKLYKYALEKRDDLKNIIMQMPTEESLISMNSEQKSYFHAIKTLLKGYSNDKIGFVGKLLEEQIAQTEYIINKLSECRGSVLYRELKSCSIIRGALKPTNIFMMDKDYKYVYRLWKLFNNNKESIDEIMLDEITDEYELYCKTMLIFALRYFNFESIQDNPIIFAGGHFQNGKYKFMNWEIRFEETYIPALDIDGITVEITKKTKHKVSVEGIVIPDAKEIAKIDFVDIMGGYLVFNRKPNENEIGRFCDLVRSKAKGDRGKEKKIYGELKKVISDSFIGFKSNVQRALLIPLTFKFPDSGVNAKRCIDGLIDQVNEFAVNSEVNACYFLTSFRPTDYSEKDSYLHVKMLLDYGYAESSNSAANSGIRYGLLPITVNDINSYRRLTKVFLMNMIEVDEELNYCPICGSNMVYDEDDGYYCSCCEFEIYKPKCKKCSNEFSFTRYPIPKVNSAKADTLNIKVLMNEVGEGFKNITAIDMLSKKPICPYCGQVLC